MRISLADGCPVDSREVPRIAPKPSMARQYQAAHKRYLYGNTENLHIQKKRVVFFFLIFYDVSRCLLKQVSVLLKPITEGENR